MLRTFQLPNANRPNTAAMKSFSGSEPILIFDGFNPIRDASLRTSGSLPAGCR
jgi:hypothetical protein